MEEYDKAQHPGLVRVNDRSLNRESWKIFQIMAEFVEGFERLARIKPSVSLFGSARTHPDNPVYKLAEDIAFARTTTTTSSPIGVQVQGDVAWTVATTRTTGTFSGREVNSAAVELMVLTKTAEGWRIRAIHWSSHKSER